MTRIEVAKLPPICLPCKQWAQRDMLCDCWLCPLCARRLTEQERVNG